MPRLRIAPGPAAVAAVQHREQLFVDFDRHGVEDSVLFEQRPRRAGRRPCGQATGVAGFVAPARGAIETTVHRCMGDSAACLAHDKPP